jgi:hypothetical protein
MIGITITAEAYAAIKATLPADTQTWPNSPGDQGDVVIWLDRATVDRLAAMPRRELQRPDHPRCEGVGRASLEFLHAIFEMKEASASPLPVALEGQPP